MITEPDTGLTMFARVKVPPLLPRFLTVSKYRFVPLEDVIAAHLTELFTGLEILEHHVFRVTRARELEVDEDVTEDLMQSLERELLRRRTEPPVRLEVEESIPPRCSTGWSPSWVSIAGPSTTCPGRWT